MKVQFRVIAKTYLEAAMIEEFFQKNSLEYSEMAMDASKAQPAPKEKKQSTARVKKLQGKHISEILNVRKMYPNYSYQKIADAVSFPISSVSVSIVCRGEHPLCPEKQKVKAVK